jgi:AhpD family alkylhydroperoxidase
MCCSTGVCGPAVDPALARFASDLQWLSSRGVRVERFNLTQQPLAFASSPLVRAALEKEGNACLPLIIVDDQIACRGEYPSRERLAALAGAGVSELPLSIYSDAVAELVAIGAAIAANCEPCFKYHFQQAKKLGVSREDMMRAVRTAQSVKEAPAKAMLQLAQRYLEGDSGLPVVQSCCGQAQ